MPWLLWTLSRSTVIGTQDMKGGNEDQAVELTESLRDAGHLRGFGKARQVRGAMQGFRL